MSIVKKALAICTYVKQPVVMWSGTGSAKTSVTYQLAEETDSKLYLINLSTMEPTDVGGFLMPVEVKGRKIIEWLMAEDRLPFITPDRQDQRCIVFFDELDRCYQQTQNAAMTLFRERAINGRHLVPSCSIIGAANGISDTGTTPITKAFATRATHLFVATSSQAALASWDDWAERKNMPPWIRGFARYRQPIIVGPELSFPEIQRPNNRTLVDAWRLCEACDKVTWGSEAVEPCVYGTVGQEVGAEMLAFRRLFTSTPTPEAIHADAAGVAIPKDVGVLWAVGRYLIDCANNDGKEKTDWTRSFARYVLRWPSEPANDWFRSASTRLPSLVSTKEYKTWEKTVK